MKQQRLNLCLSLLVSFCATLALQFPSELLGAEETPVPSGTPAAKGAAEHPSVRAVGVHKWNDEQRTANVIYAQRGDEIWVDIINFKDWVNSLGDKKPQNHEIKDLILYLDHFPLLGVSPIYWYEGQEFTDKSVEYTRTTVGFSLVRNDSSKPGWSHLLNQPVVNRKVLVSVGSAFVDASKPISADSSGNQPIVDVTRPHLEVLAELKKLRADTQKELEALQKARALISPSDKHALDNNERQQNEVRERLANYRWQSAYFAWPTWKGVMYDLLAENNLISFHRFQIFVWTLILGIMFVANVYNQLAMPEFSATLLGLLGISAGTYVGFKLPETKAQ